MRAALVTVLLSLSLAAHADEKKPDEKKPDAKPAEKAVAKTDEKKPEVQEGGGMGMMFAVIGILVLLAAVWYFLIR